MSDLILCAKARIFKIIKSTTYIVWTTLRTPATPHLPDDVSPVQGYGWPHPLPQGYADAAPRAGIFRPVRPSPVWQEHWEKRKQIIGSGMIIVQRAEFFS